MKNYIKNKWLNKSVAEQISPTFWGVFVINSPVSILSLGVSELSVTAFLSHTISEKSIIQIRAIFGLQSQLGKYAVFVTFSVSLWWATNKHGVVIAN